MCFYRKQRIAVPKAGTDNSSFALRLWPAYAIFRYCIVGLPCLADLPAEPSAFSSQSFCSELEVSSWLPSSSAGQLASVHSSGPQLCLKDRCPRELPALSMPENRAHSTATPLLSQGKWLHTADKAALAWCRKLSASPHPSSEAGHGKSEIEPKEIRLQIRTAVNLDQGGKHCMFLLKAHFRTMQFVKYM